MIEFGLLALLGAGLGAFGTLVGSGGGFLLVPILLFAYPTMSPGTVTATSLFVVLATAWSGAIAYWRQRRIDVKTGLIFAASTLPSAVVGAIAVTYVPRATFNLIFAVALFGIGAWLLAPRPSHVEIREPLTGRGVMRRRLTDRQGLSFVYGYRVWQGVAISVAVGFVSSLLGIGGGVVHVPAMVMVLRFPVYIATATSQFVLSIMAFEVVAVHLLRGTLTWDENLFRAATIAAGAIVGAQVAGAFAHRVRGDAILRALGGALILVAVRLIWVAR
ncbi:MAG: sulfite exporter TauE/SafE family protein [Dehalococcoidia bacterium]